MQVEKVNFTSSILGDMTAKAAKFQENKQPTPPTPAKEQQFQKVSQTKKQEPIAVVSTPVNTTEYKPKSKRKRNTIIGLSTVAILIGLGIAGRKGKFGPKIQKFLGGAERAAEKKGDDLADIGSEQHEIRTLPKPTTATIPPVSDMKTFQIEPANIKAALSKFDKNTRAEIERINGIIDRNIPLIDDSLKTISVPTKKECMAIIEKDVNIKKIKRSDCLIGEDGTIYYDLFKDGYKVSVEFNPDKSFRSFTKFDTRNGYKTITRIDFGEGKTYDYYDGISDINLHCDKNGDFVWLYKNITPNIILRYDNKQQIKEIINNMPTDVTKTLNHIHYENGKISRVFFYDTQTNHAVKLERLDDTGRVIQEKYEINGNSIYLDV